MTYKAIRWPLIIAILLCFGLWYSFNLFTQMGAVTNVTMSGHSEPDSTYKEYEMYITETFNDSLPNYLYQTKRNWVEKRKEGEKLVNSGSFFISNMHNKIGISEIQDNDKYFYNESDSSKKLIEVYDSLAALKITTNNTIILAEIDTKLEKQKRLIDNYELIQFDKRKTTKRWYFVLKVQSITSNGIVDFFIHNGKYKILYSKKDTIINNSKVDTKAAVKEIPVRLIVKDDLALIPISEKKYNQIKIAFRILEYFNLLFFMLIFITFPLKIMWNISKGDAFNAFNSKALFFMGISTLIIFILNTFKEIAFQYYYENLIPEEIEKLRVIDFLLGNISSLFIAIPILILAKAFKKGQSIQEENKLTI